MSEVIELLPTEVKPKKTKKAGKKKKAAKKAAKKAKAEAKLTEDGGVQLVSEATPTNLTGYAGTAEDQLPEEYVWTNEPYPIQDYTWEPYKPSIWQKVKSEVGFWWNRFMYSMPRLVWPGQEVDVTIHFNGIGLSQRTGDFNEWLAEIKNAEIKNYYDAIVALNSMGVHFDTGVGLDCAEWNFDYSLSGPVKVRYVGNRKKN